MTGVRQLVLVGGVMVLSAQPHAVHAASCTIPGFGDAAFGKDSVSFTGNGCTDSWNSANGTYTSTACTGSTCNGSVATNGNSAGAISLTGNACVKGTCTIGSGGTTSNISGSSGCNSTSVEPTPTTLPSVQVPVLPNGTPYTLSTPATPAADSTYGAVSGSGDSGNVLTLGVVGAPSQYVMSSLSLSGQSTISIPSGAGQVTVFINGSGTALSLSGGGVVNNTGKPTNLLFMCADTVTNISVTGNGTADFAVYCPNAAISVTGNGDVYGALVGKSVTDTGNGTIHYDQALGSVTSSAITCSPLEISRATPIEATVTNNNGTSFNAIVEGSYETPAFAQTAITTLASVTEFTFPSIKGHLRARANVATTSTFASTNNGETLVFDAANGVPWANNGGCGGFGAHGPVHVDGSCRNVWTNIDTGTNGFLPTVKQLNDNNAAAIGALIVPTSVVPGINGSCTGIACWTRIVRTVLTGQSGTSMLGGIDRSTVAVVPASVYAGTARPTIAYVGATDGMLHAVCASKSGACTAVGTELWAFMPRVQLPLVRTNTTRIDGSPHVVDAFDDFYGTGSRSWRTVLTFQTMSGSATTPGQTPAVYALDVTDPANPSLLWEYTTPATRGVYELGSGLTLGAGVVKYNGMALNVVYAETNNGGTGGAGVVVTAINAATGSRLWMFGSAYPSGNNLRVPADGSIPATGVPGGVTIADTSGSGYLTDVVFGDLYGQIWDLDPATGIDKCGSNMPLFSFSGGTGDSPFGAVPTIYSNGVQQFAVIGSGGYTDPSSAGQWGSGTPRLVGVSLNTNKTSSCAAGKPLDQSSPVSTTGLAFATLSLTGKDFAQAIVIGAQLFITTSTTDINASGYNPTGSSGHAYSLSLASPTSFVDLTGFNTIGGAASLAFTASSGTATLYSQQQQLTAKSATGVGPSVDNMNTPRMIRDLWLRTQ